MNAAEIAYLEARIEEERYRKAQEADEAYRRDMEALEVVRGLYERYGAVEVEEAEEPGPGISDVLKASVEVSELQAAHDPLDAGDAVEEEQRVEEGEPEPEPVQPEESAESEVSEGFKLCKKCGPTVGPKHVEEFGKDKRTHDGHAATCIDCMREVRRAGRQKQLDAAKAGEERRCANGLRCVEALGEGMDGEPAILRKGYEHDACTSCRRRAGVAA